MMRKTALFAALMVTTASVARAQWQPVPLVSQAQKARVQIGGEGAQWGRALAWSGDGSLALWGTDVGGLFRSSDGGKAWEPCNVGYTPRGTAGLAIDPHNPRRVLSIGANSVVSEFHGVWLSEDGAASWRQVLSARIAGSQDNREQIAFDPASYDAQTGRTRVVYWSRIGDDQANWGEPEKHPALYKSSDGGQSWVEIAGTAQIGASILKVHPTRGVVYAANSGGFYCSSDGGASWTQTVKGAVTGVDVSRQNPESVWITTPNGVWQSRDAGEKFEKMAASANLVAPDEPLRNIHVCPVDARQMVLWREGASYQWPRFYSRDGGATWQQSRIDGSLSFLPTNARQGLFAWHPREAGTLLSMGGDYPTRSTDGGATYAWTGDGVNNILSGANQFNVQNPDVMFISSQDYNGASTSDGGRTWIYQNPSGNGWGGFTYGGYALSESVMVVAQTRGGGEPRELTVTRDAGRNWTKTGLFFSGSDHSLGAPNDANVVFASNFRSADAAKTWAPMPDCDAVLTFNPRSGELWGTKKAGAVTRIVSSSDNGTIWRVRASRAEVSDLAIDPRGELWAVSQDALWKCEGINATLATPQGPIWRTITDLPPDQWGAPRVRSVALDPQNPDLIYLATNRDIFSSSASALRSRDGGATWENLTRQTPLGVGDAGKDGGREALWVRVQPRTREAWFMTGCYGIWKIGAP